MDINQSLIKRMDKPYCPKKVKAELDGVFKRTPSEAMIKGQYFEWKIFGTRNREGEIPVPDRKKNGEKRLDQIRLERQVQNFHKILKKEGIKIFGTDRTFHTELFGINTHGTWDAYGLRKGKPIIIDIKVTGDVENTFGDFSWGDFGSMDKIQAKKYMVAGRHIDDVPYDFLYMVFDFSPRMNHRLFPVPFEKEFEFEVKFRIHETVNKIILHDRTGWKAIGFPNECKDCMFSGSCPIYMDKNELQEKRIAKNLSGRPYDEDLENTKKELDEILINVFA